jgi:hypothetical protein
MVRLEVDTVSRFFDNCMFSPMWVKGGVTIPWDISLDEYTFACHTSYITENLLNEELVLEIEETLMSASDLSKSQSYSKLAD